MISPEPRAQRLREEREAPAGPRGEAFLKTLSLGGCRVEVRVRGGPDAPAGARTGPGLANGVASRHPGPPTSAEPHVPLVRERDVEDSEPDLEALAARARGMAQGLRIVLERKRDGARSLAEVSTDEPELQRALEQAGAERGRRIWFLGRSGRRLWPEELRCVAGCYEALAEAAALARCLDTLRDLEPARRLRAYQRIAETQSALRKALRDLAGLRRSDPDRLELFEWLRERLERDGLYVQRYMRSGDHADPWAWPVRMAHLRALRHDLRDALRRQRQLDELLELVRFHARKIPERRTAQDRWRDWCVLDQVVRWLDRLGAQGTEELRAALAGVAHRAPDGLALSPELVVALDQAARAGRARSGARPRGKTGRARAPLRRARAQASLSVQGLFEQFEASHPERLCFRPNNHSDRDYPYDRPEELAEALRWLVGPYWETRVGRLRADHRELDRRLRRACGWSYRTTQSPSTVGRYRSWYETLYEGRRLDVLEHIGRGNAKRQGPHSIRIGFTWDEPTRRIVVGFVGQHQRNRDS